MLVASSWRVLARAWVLSLAVTLPLLTLPVFASASSKVIPPQAKPYGLTYGQWSAKWWQWSLSLPVAGHPLSGTEPGNCLAGQVRPVYFVGGVISGSATQTRTCTIAPGTAIYFPVAN